jgi:hypothetical protein
MSSGSFANFTIVRFLTKQAACLKATFIHHPRGRSWTS